MITAELVHCPPSQTTALERTRFFPRQLITPDDLTQDQRYFRDKLRRHNRFLHGWGVVCGAGVRKHTETGKVVVEPGYVLGPWGDEIVIDDEVVVDLFHETTDGLVHAGCADPADPWCSDVRVERRVGPTFYLAVRYDECDTRPVRVATDVCGCDLTECQYSRTRDKYAMKLLAALPASYTTAPATSGTTTSTTQRCIEFKTPARQPGSKRVVDGVTLEVVNDPVTAVVTRDGFVGLQFSQVLRVTLPQPTVLVTFTLRHAFDAVRIQSVHADGSTQPENGRPTSSPQPEKFNITGAGITGLVINTKDGLLIDLCYEAHVERQDAQRPCPPCPEDPWVILADVGFKNGGEVDAVDSQRHRRWVASLAGQETISWAAAQPPVSQPSGPGGVVRPGRRPIDVGRLGTLLNRDAVRRWQESGGDPATVGDLPVTALKGTGSALGRVLGALRLGARGPGEVRLRDVADTPRDGFVAQVLETAPRGAARSELERRAAEAWTRARQLTGHG